MKINRNFLGGRGGGGCKTKTYHGGSIGYFLKLHIAFCTCMYYQFYKKLPQKIPIISPGFIFFFSKGCLAGFILGEAYFQRDLLSEGILRFKMGFGLTIKTA